MLRKLAASLAILCLVGPSLAQNVVQLAPRVPYSKKPNHQIVLPAEGDVIRLIVKFHDNLRVRATADERVVSLANHDMGNVLDLAAQTGIKFRKAINHSLDKLTTLQNRAGVLSKRGQPDLGGIMYIEGERAVMLQVARALNGMPDVEYVEFEPVWITHQELSDKNGKIDDQQGGDPLAGHGGPGCGDPNSTNCDTVDPDNPFCNDVLCCEAVCNFDPTCCEDTWDNTCVILAATLCVGLPVLECGAEVALSCFVAHPPYYVACDNTDCCEIVCALDPGCCNDWWDERCAIIALLECKSPICVEAEQDCFVEHVDPEEAGCNDGICCGNVCEFDAYCCSVNWDFLCAEEALIFCKGGEPNLCGVIGTGDCNEANNSPYCDDAECCSIVCSMDPFCCDSSVGNWDELCVILAGYTCNIGPAHDCDEDAKDCYQAHPPFFSNCNDPACCSLVCGVDPFCCAIVWDSICAGFASQICRDGDICANPLAGPCFNPHLGIGCRIAECCNAVCDIDPTCCNTEWDEECASIATGICSTSPTPDFTPLQGYLTLESYFDSDGNNPPQGLAFPAPSATGFTGEGHDMPGLWEFGEFILGLGNGDENLTRGKGARIGVIEHSAWVDHEDLINKVISEPGQTIIHMEGVVISSNHGTATLGITVAEDNGFGITGMAPEAQGYFFPIVSVEEGGRILSAMTAALLVFEHGDVLSYSIGPGGGTLDSTFSTNLMLRLSSDLGIISCISAGNDCINLDEDDEGGNSLPDSGAVTVGAGFPGVPWCRLGFSNHGDCLGRVHCQSWGTAVTTTGYGALFSPSPDEPQRHYTNDFGGTSAAAPIIAGLAADLQGIAKMFYGIPLMPEQIRGVMAGSGFPQCLADPCEQGVMPGAEDGTECGGDPSLEEAPNAIGFFPDPPTCAEAIIITSWFDGSPFIDGIEILRGTLVSGNVFSIRESDNNRLVIKSQFTHPNDNQGLGINYLATGQVTDLLVHAHVDDVTQPFENLLITSERHQSDVPFICNPAGNIPTANGLTFYEMWNWITQKWDFIIFDPAAGTDCNISPPQNTLVPAPQRFVRQTDGKMQLRVWTLSLGGNFGGFGGGGTQPYFVRHDHINIRTTGLSGGNIPTPP